MIIMNLKALGIIGAVSLAIASPWANAQQPPGVGAAAQFPATCLFTVVVEVGEDDIRIASIVDVDDNKLTVTNSKNGNVQLNCSGKLDRSAPVTGFQIFPQVPPNTEITGRLLTYEEGCTAVETLVGDNPCRGNGPGAALSGFEPFGITCNLPIGPGVFRTTEHWRQVTTPGDRVKLYCHWNAKTDGLITPQP
jgi:hypothetical protein